MRHNIQLRVFAYLILLFFVALTVMAGPLEDGYRAFEAKDYKTAYRYWQPLAEQNNPDALFNLGLMAKNGWGMKKDYKQAMKWFKKAAYYGSADAAYNLGVMYISGETGFPSSKDAIYWWKQAAEQGHHESQYNYGVMLAYGKGIEKDVPAALKWWKLAAQQGDVNAINALVRVYEQGLLGQKKDPQKAAYWKQFAGK